MKEHSRYDYSDYKAGTYKYTDARTHTQTRTHALRVLILNGRKNETWFVSGS